MPGRAECLYLNAAAVWVQRKAREAGLRRDEVLKDLIPDLDGPVSAPDSAGGKRVSVAHRNIARLSME